MNPTLTLVATAFNRNQLIFPEIPQIALAGRSNVGKSSLVNALAGRRQLAKTSSTPGKTRSINYYALNGSGFAEPTHPSEGQGIAGTEGFTHEAGVKNPTDQESQTGRIDKLDHEDYEDQADLIGQAEDLDGKRAFLVDLPGYGYAKCSKAERNAWAQLLELYLRDTPGLLALALLIDSRLPPQKIDIQLAQMALGMGLPIIPVLTKIDKSKQKERDACVKGWSAIMSGFTPILTSSQTKKGVDELWETFVAALS